MNLDAIRRVLVVGAGTMGHGIALVYARSGRQVDLVDLDLPSLERARSRIRSGLETLATVGEIHKNDVETIQARIHFGTDLESVMHHADLVTEAILEDKAAKTALFRTLDQSLRPDVILASNTSGLDVFDLAAEAAPARLPFLLIHHYFLPAAIVPLVEVVKGPQTRPEVVELSIALLEQLGKAPVLLDRFTPNFIVNSFQVALGGVVARLLAEGVATPELIDKAVKNSLGVRLPIVGVAQTLDFTGLDLFARILRHTGVDASYFEALVEQGRTGAVAGRGLYDYGGRPIEQIEQERDRKYWKNLQSLREIGGFDPL